MNTKTTTLYTAQDAAQQLGCTDARIRQICGDPAATIGRKHGTAWILTPQDLRQIKKVLRKFQKS